MASNDDLDIEFYGDDYRPPYDDDDEQNVDIVNEEPPIEDVQVRWHPKTTEAEKNDTFLRSKSKDPSWKYSILLMKNEPNKVLCLLCRWISTGGIGRMKGHLLGNDSNCIPCPNVTSFIRKEIREYVQEKKMKVFKGKSKVEDFGEEQPDVIVVKDKSSDPKKLKRPAVATSSSGSINTKVKNLSLNSGVDLRQVIKERKKQPLIVDKLKKDQRLYVDKLVAKAFYACGIPFNVRNNIHFQVFLLATLFLEFLKIKS